MKRAAVVLLALMPLLTGCNAPWSDSGDRAKTARDFPPADRPVAPTVSTNWSTEEARDRVNEADDVMDSSDVRPGMTVADIARATAITPCGWRNGSARAGACWRRTSCPK